MTPGYETLLYEERGPVAWVTLNRPEVHNAFNAAMQRELHDCWQSLRTNDAIRVVVLRGAGDKAFCSGIDRTEALADYDQLHDVAMVGNPSDSPFMFDSPAGKIAPKANDLWKPVIAAVNGMAAAGAFYILGECDILIAAEDATFFDSHVTFGMVAAFESIYFASRMPMGELIRMQLTGNHERVSATRAYEIGLVSEVVPLAELDTAATTLAESIASAPPLAVQGTLRAIWAGYEHDRAQALRLGYAFVGLGNTRETLEEGQRAFASGRRVEPRLR
jgi:enoyl-CoA hydratase/carnithine racemase